MKNIENQNNHSSQGDFKVDETQINALLFYAELLKMPYSFTILQNSPSIREVQIHMSSLSHDMELSASFLCEESRGQEFELDFKRVEVMFDFAGVQHIRFYSMPNSVKSILRFIELAGKE
ncbi:hypothetical protein MNQ98_12600 [Paenibacillus sp. N3/727]|uniref:hypothetical protein n=1 Tax=Paenibacillus sp. N3/727 TaxID=2925845 RepID=UPI001F53B6F7|nr:hypothetical protein [Paenibacillus sp. N3/727]UNK20791.1 hypothetical protein MNQ98_12600 [Paenibacillus sp. N3/727]